MNESISKRINKPDMLVFLSDQHHAGYAGFAGHPLVRTPHLDRLAQEGTVMSCAYTASPLCVPSRMAMLTGQLPEKTGVYTNEGTIGGDQATFLHGIAAEGYETVLCGRMHFLGEDQRHGFTRRIMGDLTPLFWGRYGRARSDLGPYVGTMANESLKIMGGGTSPVLEYDKAVIRAALDYLSQDHDKPQCIVVGTYGPHHTFVAPPDLYAYYKERIDIPASFAAEEEEHPLLGRMRPDGLTLDRLRKLRSAYLGMIETIDGQVGAVRAAWDRYLERRSRQGVFVYMSDHGEQAGEHGLIGKQTFYEGSAKIPVLFAGSGISAGHTVTEPVSILDLGPTLCELAGAQTPPRPDGRSLAPQLAGAAGEAGRTVVSEMLFASQGGAVAGRMLRTGRWKYIAYASEEAQDQLFDLEADPQELRNLVRERPDIAGPFRESLADSWDAAGIIARFEAKREHHRLLARWGGAVDVAEPERWKVPVEAQALPVIE
ncbi:choline-sulfatase [Paenibacillus sp. UNCCL117]|uniref:sulfatase-like hydrolase/transferase n=1 Tax=unclassified Paenibacillus TaxID=185978 RepID=UPI0008846058|nr:MULTISPECIES: sulfatase-like hydrolase/transferase [unclassified Paenibacillus]SDE20421.1 choline-sulfatase [Paenibacillus sp. cl123]SFW61759.1 choline-sulfatase [Paenibacillus sp. UNCCL117]